MRVRSDDDGEAIRPLVVLNDPELLDDLLRLGAACGVELTLARDPIDARRSWSRAPLVLLGVDSGAACARARLPRRGGVVVVARGADPRMGSGVRALVPRQRVPVDEPWSEPAVPPDVWAVASELGAEHVAFLPTAERWLVDRLADVAADPERPGQVLGVIGGRGGAGASVLAAGLAVTAARFGMRSLLVDADPLGGGLDLVMGRESSAGVRWPDLVATAGRVSASALLDALPRVGEACVLSWDRGDVLAVPPAAIDAALDAGRRGADLVVVDLPRWPDEAAVRALQGSDTVLLVVPAEVRACAAAHRVVTMIGPHCAEIRCVVRGPAPAGLRSRDLVEALRLPLAGVLKPEPRLPAALERGDAPAERGRGPLADLCRQLLSDLGCFPMAA